MRSAGDDGGRRQFVGAIVAGSIVKKDGNRVG
jgi:hypothetical protein